jgi:hypothetical protein
MKTIMSLLAATGLLAGVVIASAQQGQMDGNKAPISGGGESSQSRNGSSPSVPTTGSSGGAVTNQSGGAMNPAGTSGSTSRMDEQANGTNGAVERNPDGSTGGSKSNPSPR